LLSTLSVFSRKIFSNSLAPGLGKW
jgi:hypothetical protein